MNSIVNRVSTSPQSLPQTLSLLPTDKISTPNPNPAAAPTALALLVAATEQSHYLPAETPAPPPPPVVAAMPDSDPNHPTAQSQSNESIPQDVAFSPGRAVSAQEGGRIPKKDLPAPNGMFEGLQLPPGVVLPDTVTPDILAGKPIRMLLELPPNAMTEALSEFDAAVKEKGSEIRSLPAYLVGVMKRYRNIKQASHGANHLSDRVLARLNTFVTSGYCSQTEIDDKIKAKLAMMTENEGLSAIQELSNIKREDIRSFSSYFMGIMNRYANNKNNGNRSQRHRSNHQQQHSGDGNLSHYGRAGSNDNKNDRHGRDRNRGSRERRRRSRSHSRSRSRSRDRHRRRRRSYSSSRSRSRSDSRDRHSRRRRRRSRSDSRDRHRDDRPSRFGSKVTAIPPPPPPRHGMNYPYSQKVPPPPPGRAAMQQPVNDNELEKLFQAAGVPAKPHQGVPVNQINAGQPTPITLPSNLNQQQIQALQSILGQGQNAQHQPSAAHVGWSGQQANIAQGQPWQQQHSAQTPGATWQTANKAHTQPAAPLDILGLAEKAAQALGQVPTAQPTTSFYSRPMHNTQNSVTSEKDLSTMIQYAIQNLRVSGHVEATLDPNVCAMLKKLPETNALLSLETFLGCDVSKMKNKNAYLAGILKRELNKIGLS